jgi:hypothetical protein
VCIHIFIVDDLPAIALWDPDEVGIRVARGPGWAMRSKKYATS